MKSGKIALADIYVLARSKEFIRELSLPIVNNDEKERYVRKSSITTEKCQSFSELLGQEREWIAAVVAATVLVALVATMGAKEKNVVWRW